MTPHVRRAPIGERVQPCRRWLRDVPPRVRRLLTVLALLPVLWLGQLGFALADDGAGRLGQTPAGLAWIELADSRGISVWNYELSLDRGGVTAPGKTFWSAIIDMLWQLYRCGVVIAVWFIDWVLSFSWLDPIIGPVMTLSGNLTDLMGRVGGVTMLLTIAAVAAVWQMARGSWALGLTELTTSLVIASVATGLLANPVAMVAGPHGALMGSRSIGLEIADGLTGGGGSTPGGAEAMRQQLSGQLVDTFIRIPTETLNFGTVLDGGPCESTYTDVIRAGPYGQDDDIREAMGGCDDALGEVAANPSAGQAASAAIISPAAAFVLAFALLLAGTVLLAALSALYQGLKLIVTLVAGLLPGGARGVLWITVADLVMSLVTLAFSIVFLSGYLLLIGSVFASADPDTPPMQTFFVVDVLLVAGLLLFWRARAALKRAAGKLAAALASRPGAGATTLPQKRPFDAAGAYYKAQMAGAAASTVAGTAGNVVGPARELGGRYATSRDRMWAGARNAASDARVDLGGTASWLRWASRSSTGQPQPATSARPHGGRGPALPPSPPRAIGDSDGTGHGQPAGTPGPRAPSGAPQRLLAVTGGRKPAGGRGRLVRTAGQLALAAGTGGTSAVAGTAGKTVAKTAARTAVRSTLHRAQAASRAPAPATPSAPAGLPGTPPPPPLAARRAPQPSNPPVTTGPLRPPAGRSAPTPPGVPSHAGRVIDQDGRPQPEAAVRLQQRLHARRPPTSSRS